ncbi:MAG: AbgT family transporter [Kiritimatiellae bacterium]|nr:AbgT family transporter [Kiritimatiellia bacterium]
MKNTEKKSFFERIASKIPDPVILFLLMYAVLFVATVFSGGMSFSLPSVDGASGESVETVRHIRNMAEIANVQWIFNNAIVTNWLAFANGLVGILIVAMLGLGVAEASGMFSVLLKLAGGRINQKLLPYVIVFAGILSNIAGDAGYIILIPLAAALYCAMGRNPLIGVAASFAGVSAGFGANIIPATTPDLLVGIPAKNFAVSQGVPWVSYLGAPLNEATMDYFYTCSLVFVFTILGGWITNRFVAPKLDRLSWTVPEDAAGESIGVSHEEVRDLKWAGLGLLVALGAISFFAFGPLKGHFAKNIIIFVSFAFFMSGLFYGVKRGKFHSAQDVVSAMVNQVKELAYMLVLTFFCFNFLAALTYSGVGAYITYCGVKVIMMMNLGSSPVLLLIAFIAMGAFVNLFVASLSAKWLMLGPIFIPMLYHVNPSLTPEVVCAAYRTADPCTNIVTPVMTYMGVILLYCRRYVPHFAVGDLLFMMVPYSAVFLGVATTIMIIWFKLGIPFGF